MVDIVKLLAYATFVSNIFLALFIVLYIFSRFSKKANVLFARIIKYFSGREIQFAFIVALVATLGSLYFSEIANFAPCKLCWLQRICMYPQVIILGTALIKKRKDVAIYSLPLAAIGIAIAGYHYVLQLTPNAFAPCSTVGFSVSCSEKFFTYFGFITIPWMAFSAFALIITSFLIKDHKSALKIK